MDATLMLNHGEHCITVLLGYLAKVCNCKLLHNTVSPKFGLLLCCALTLSLRDHFNCRAWHEVLRMRVCKIWDVHQHAAPR